MEGREVSNGNGPTPASYEMADDDYVPPFFALNGDYEDADFEFETATAREPLRVKVTGWRQAGCDIIWSTIMPELVALNLDQLVGRTALELGAGCGLVGLVASHTADQVVITDGDVLEVSLCKENVDRHAPSGARVEAAHLAWGEGPARTAQEKGLLGGVGTFDIIFASQVTYVPACIPALVQTFATLLAPGGEVWMFNDRVSYSLGPEGQAECRACLDRALSTHGLVVAGAGADAGWRLPPAFAALPDWAYLLRLRRKSPEAG
jgi:hypothetical protein